MLIWTCTPAQAEFLGTLQGNQPWTLEFDNSNDASAAALTIFYLGAKNFDFDIHTVPGAESITFNISKMPRGTTRVIIEVTRGRGDTCPVRVIQGVIGLTSPGFESRLVIDVV
jgi:hypothetical protein